MCVCVGGGGGEALIREGSSQGRLRAAVELVNKELLSR